MSKMTKIDSLDTSINDYVLHPGVQVNLCMTQSDAQSIIGKDKVTIRDIKTIIPPDWHQDVQSKTSNSVRYYYPLIHKDRIPSGNSPTKRGRPPKNPKEEVEAYEEEEDVNKEGEEVEDPKDFKFNTTHVHLTYKTHLPLQKYLIHVQKLLRNVNNAVIHYSIVNERAEKEEDVETSEDGNSEEEKKPKKRERKTPYPHTHAAFSFRDNLKEHPSNFFDYEGIHPHINIPRRVPANCSTRVDGTFAQICCKYHRKEKEAKRISNFPMASLPTINKKGKITGWTPTNNEIRAIKTPDDAMEIISQSSRPDYMKLTKIQQQAKSLQSHKGEEAPVIIEKQFHCQSQVRTLIKVDFSDRTIIWIVDQGGCNGKSTLCDHMESENCIIITLDKGIGNIAHILKDKLIKCPNPDAIIFDLAKAKGEEETFHNKKDLDHYDVYNKTDKGVEYFGEASDEKPINDPQFFSFLERLKNARFSAPKFDSSEFKIPKGTSIVVFANQKPDLKSVIIDRWIICNIGYDKKINAQLYGMSGEETIAASSRMMTLFNDDSKITQQIKYKTLSDAQDLMRQISYNVMDAFWSRERIPVIDYQGTFECIPNQEPGTFDNTKKMRITMRSRPMTEKEKHNYAIRMEKQTILEKKKEREFRGAPISWMELFHDDMNKGMYHDRAADMMYEWHNRRSMGETIDEILASEENEQKCILYNPNL